MTLWFFHILMPIAVMTITLLTSELIQISSALHIFLTTTFTVYGCIAVWTISLLSWAISFFIYEYLINIKQSLTLEFYKNSGLH
jgi:hypothetical protein